MTQNLLFLYSLFDLSQLMFKWCAVIYSYTQNIKKILFLSIEKVCEDYLVSGKTKFYAEPFCLNSFLIALWSDRKPIVQRKCKEQLRKEIKKSRYCSAAPPFPKIGKNRQWPDEILNTHRPILFSYTTFSETKTRSLAKLNLNQTRYS